MPLIGYGTYQTPPSITEHCVADALKVGYRSIDTAQYYGNEHEVGLACRKSGIPREELFIITKLWACHGYEDTLRSIDGSLRKLGGENNIFRNPVLMRIAEKHGRSVAQVALHFLVQQSIIVIPKSTKPEHMSENLAVLDFELEQEDMTDLEGLEVGRSLFGWW